MLLICREFSNEKEGDNAREWLFNVDGIFLTANLYSYFIRIIIINLNIEENENLGRYCEIFS